MKFTESDYLALTERVERLESQSRRWRLTTAFLGIGGISFLLMGAKPAGRTEPPAVRASTVEAQEFILKDESGHVYARLSLNPSLRIKQLNGSNGRTYLIPRDALAIQGQPALQFFDDKGDVIWTVPQEPMLRPVK